MHLFIYKFDFLGLNALVIGRCPFRIKVAIFNSNDKDMWSYTKLKFGLPLLFEAEKHLPPSF